MTYITQVVSLSVCLYTLIVICLKVNLKVDFYTPIAVGMSMDEEEIRAMLSKKLKSFRAEKGLSQMALASKAEIATNFVNDIENGKKWISPSTLSKLSQALEISPYRFFLPVQPSVSDDNTVIQQFCTELSNQFIETVNTLAKKYTAK